MKLLVAILMTCIILPSYAQLIVVSHKGGVSIQPYYDELDLQPETPTQVDRPIMSDREMFTDADMLPVRSEKLSPGGVSFRAIQASGLTPFFLIGDDELSKRWLIQRKDTLLQLNAVGFVVNIESKPALEQLRTLTPNLTLVPVSGDDIAQRLQLEHYPVLITSSSIEQ